MKQTILLVVGFFLAIFFAVGGTIVYVADRLIGGSK